MDRVRFFVMHQRPLFVMSTIALNAIAFGLWKFTDTYPFMKEHFLVSYTALEDGYYWTLLSSVFSHNMFFHFFINMFVLHNFGRFLENYLGTLQFGIIYLLSGIMGSLSHSLTSGFFIGDPSLPALGASGAVAGIILVFSLCFPKEKILLFGIVPIPALFGAFLFIGLDLWGLYEQSVGSGFPIGHGAHLGGAFTGLFCYFFLLKRH